MTIKAIAAAALFALAATACGGTDVTPTASTDDSLLARRVYGHRFIVEAASDVVDEIDVPAAHRDQPIPVQVHLPEGASGEVPVIVWTHGGGFVDRGADSSQGRHWAKVFAAAGYAVVLVTHETPTPGELDAMCDSLDAPRPSEVCDALQDREATYFKPADTSGVIDALFDRSLEAALATWGYNLRFDIERIVVGGWSGGSGSALRLAGAGTVVHDDFDMFYQEDPRPIAFIATSPAGDPPPGELGSGFQPESWSRITRPVLTITAHGDRNDKLPDDRVKPHYRMPGGDKYQLYVNSEETRHGSMNLSPDDTRHHRAMIASAGLAFVNAQVFHQPRARGYLAGTRIERLMARDPTLRRAIDGTELPPEAHDLSGAPVPAWSRR